MIRPTKVEALPGYRLHLWYSDGIEGEVDLSQNIGRGVFAPLADEVLFGQVRIGEYGQIAWSDDLDICPDPAYHDIIQKCATGPVHA